MTNRFTDFLKTYDEEFGNAGKELLPLEMPELTEELFAIYENTGSRLEYEEVYFYRRKFLTVFAMLSIMHGKKEHFEKLEKIIDNICDEETWALPAHVDRSIDNWQITIDLFAAETAFSLAEIVCMLEKKLSAEVVSKARDEIHRRVLNPFMESEFPYAWWETSKMNWCAVCCGSVGAAAIWLMQKETEKEKYIKVIDRINKSILNYIDGFSSDGACLEGLGYYTYGMSFFVSYADLMYKLSVGKTNLFEHEKMKNIALFQQKSFLSKKISISFSDCEHDEKYRVGLTAYLSKRYRGVRFPDYSLAAGLESDHCYRYIVLSRDYFWTKNYVGNSEGDVIWHTVLPDAQWSICKSDNNCAMAAKGGHNDEPHNHNDVGSFLYICDDEYILDDLGAGEYTKDYFGERRYDNLCCRSLGHNVPLIGGREQYAGVEYKASRFEADGFGKTEMEIQEAYGLGKEEKIKRTIGFKKENGRCKVVDEFVISHNKVITENLVTSHKPKIKDDGFVIASRKNVFEIKVKNGVDFEILKEDYTDHFGVKKRAWFMQWRVEGNRSEMVIKKVMKEKRH